ncbi:unnamed protein product [Symbiodinium natans]|uniref:Uncharacterized protein n=1 Tax=Symbiodinium natans TaxID=878477 RepID=A0A812V6V2_9DINO|nr:unnamed protein product [Symbiodinium natans]CAE7604978.1 unnamed protein product [Symbiodinium natans]
MAMALRSFVAVALLAVVVAEDIPQLPATALEALPQSFWDNFVYCKCGLSCAEKDGSIGKACGCLVCPESNGTSLRGSQPSHADQKSAVSAEIEQVPARQGTPQVPEKSFASGWDLPSVSPVSCPCGKYCAKGRILGLWNYWCFRYECKTC